jgi:hypothetical protein
MYSHETGFSVKQQTNAGTLAWTVHAWTCRGIHTQRLRRLWSGGQRDSPSDSGGAAVSHASELAHAFSSDLSARLWAEIIDDRA